MGDYHSAFYHLTSSWTNTSITHDHQNSTKKCVYFLLPMLEVVGGQHGMLITNQCMWTPLCTDLSFPKECGKDAKHMLRTSFLPQQHMQNTACVYEQCTHTFHMLHQWQLLVHQCKNMCCIFLPGIAFTHHWTVSYNSMWVLKPSSSHYGTPRALTHTHPLLNSFIQQCVGC